MVIHPTVTTVLVDSKVKRSKKGGKKKNNIQGIGETGVRLCHHRNFYYKKLTMEKRKELLGCRKKELVSSKTIYLILYHLDRKLRPLKQVYIILLQSLKSSKSKNLQRTLYINC